MGQLPEPASPSRWAHVWSDDPLVQGLARLSNCPHSNVLVTGAKWLAQLPPGEHLLTLSAPRGVEWRGWLNQLEEVWFTSLFKALKKREVDMLALYPGNEHVFMITGVRHWWRRRQNWQKYCSG